MTIESRMVTAIEPFIEMIVERVRAQLVGDGDHEPWITLKEAAQYAGCSPDTLRRAARAGQLEVGRVRSDFRVRRSAVDRWMLGQVPSAEARVVDDELDGGDLSEDTKRILGSLGKEEK